MIWTQTPQLLDDPADIGPDGGRQSVPMQQHAYYGRTCTALGSRTQSFTAGPADDPLGCAHVLIRRWPMFGDFALLARGPVWQAPMTCDAARLATRALITQLRRTCRGVIVTPDTIAGQDPMQGDGLLPLVTGGCQARLSLAGTAADRMARQHGKWRNRLRRALDADLTLHDAPFPADRDHWLLTREEAQSQSRGYRRLSASFTHAWATQNGPQSTRLFTAQRNGEPLAAMLFLLHGSAASYHIGWSGEEGRALGAHNRLLWEACNWLAARGFDWVDLGTLDTETTPGLARFKLGSGAEPLPLGATWLEAPGARGIAALFSTFTPEPQKSGQIRHPSKATTY